MDKEFIIIKNNEYQNYTNEIKESFIELKNLTSQNQTVLEEMKTVMNNLYQNIDEKRDEKETDPLQSLYQGSKDFINGFLFGTLLSIIFYKFF